MTLNPHSIHFSDQAFHSLEHRLLPVHLWALWPSNFLSLDPHSTPQNLWVLSSFSLICPSEATFTRVMHLPISLVHSHICMLTCMLSCVWISDPRGCSPPTPGFPVHGSSQAKMLEWVAISYSRGSSQLRGRTHFSWISCTHKCPHICILVPRYTSLAVLMILSLGPKFLTAFCITVMLQVS